MQPISTHLARTLQVLGITALLSGCTTPGEHRASPAVTAAVPIAPENAEYLVPFVRYGRYTLVELRPEPGQRDLTQQLVDVTMPAQLSATVGDGMRHLLLRTGYSLCQTEEAAALYALPLPAAHLRLGPQTLRDALQTLAGPAWRLTIDQGMRQVCFARPPEPLLPAHAGGTP